MLSGKRTSEKSDIPKTLSQTIYNYIKEAVISNQLTANQRIIEKDIARKFGVSTTPVREAIVRLAAEGYLFIESHRKTLVKEVSYEELIEILEVLAELDSIAITNIVDAIQPGSLHRIRELTKKMERAGMEREVEKFLEINSSIHKTIWDLCPNKIMQKTLISIHEQLMRYTYSRITAFKEPEIIERSIEDHKKILQALEEKNTKALKSSIKSNWKLVIELQAKKEGEGGRN